MKRCIVLAEKLKVTPTMTWIHCGLDIEIKKTPIVSTVQSFITLDNIAVAILIMNHIDEKEENRSTNGLKVQY